MRIRQVKAHFSLDYESRVRGANDILLYGNFSDPKGGRVSFTFQLVLRIRIKQLFTLLVVESRWELEVVYLQG